MNWPEPSGPFEVEFSATERARLRQLGERAVQLGIGPRFVEEVRVILEKLAFSPREWGDPLYPYRALRLTMFRGIHSHLAVTFAVHDRLPIVFVRDIKPILGHPLAEI